MKPVVLIARNDLTRRIRNRSALIVAFVGPLAMAIVFSVLIQGATTPNFHIGIVDLDQSSTSTQVVNELLAQDKDSSDAPVHYRAVTGTDAEAMARKRVDKGDDNAAIVFPAGFEAATSGASGGAPKPITVIRNPRRLVSGQIAESVAQSISQGFEKVRLAVATATLVGASAANAAIVTAARAKADAVVVDQQPPGAFEANAGAFYGAAMSILFLFFTVGYAAKSLLAEREDHTLQRMLASGARPVEIIAGKTIAVSLLGLAGFVVVWGVTTLGFGAKWGDPLTVFCVIVVTVLAIAGVGTFVASLARTDRQADGYTTAVTFVLALLGGNFVGPGAITPTLRKLSAYTPNGWSLRAFTDLSADAARIGDVTKPIVILLAFAVGFGSVGMVLIRRAVPS
ncbi:MAG: ABC transporter permease [Acidimicrobiia bacterium]